MPRQPIPNPSLQEAWILGDSLAAGTGSTTLALRLSRPGLIAHDLSTAGRGLAGVLTRTHEVQVRESDIVVLAVGIDDAARSGLRMEAWESAFIAICQHFTGAKLFVVKPPEIPRDVPLPDGYNKDSRRWVRRAHDVLERLAGAGLLTLVKPDLEATHYTTAIALTSSGYDVVADAVIASVIKEADYVV